MGRKIDPLVVVALTLILVATVSCEPMLVVRVTTQVYEDGSMARQVEVVGRDDKGQVPTEREWLAETAGVRLADPEAWARLDETPGRVAAEGFFQSADDLPALLAYGRDGTTRNCRSGPRVRTSMKYSRQWSSGCGARKSSWLTWPRRT